MPVKFETIAFSAHRGFKRSIREAAEREGVSLSRWVRWVLRRAIALDWKMNPSERIQKG